ncbi:hypothetical protein M2169_005164 [Streptomyces sp. MJP52]|nr:hypothetical protein [Streptomyces sp. MJP52]
MEKPPRAAGGPHAFNRFGPKCPVPGEEAVTGRPPRPDGPLRGPVRALGHAPRHPVVPPEETCPPRARLAAHRG